MKLLIEGQRITKGNLKKNPELRTQIRILDRLPISKVYFESIIESVDEYDRRRVWQAIDEFIELNQNFTYFAVAEKSKVSKSRFQQLRILVDDYLLILGYPKLEPYRGQPK